MLYILYTRSLIPPPGGPRTVTSPTFLTTAIGRTRRGRRRRAICQASSWTLGLVSMLILRSLRVCFVCVSFCLCVCVCVFVLCLCLCLCICVCG